MKPFKIDAAGVLKIALGVLGLVQMVLSSKADEHDRNALKDELKNEILKDLNRNN